MELFRKRKEFTNHCGGVYQKGKTSRNLVRIYAPIILLVVMTIFSIYDSHFFS